MKKYFLFIILFFSCLSVFSQKYTISGYIEDAKTGEKLISAGVFDSNTSKGTITNDYGFFSLTLPQGQIKFTVSYVGYTSFSKTIDLNKDIELNIVIEPSITLSEVVVTDSKSKDKVESTQISAIEIPIKDIKKLPVLLGEVDVLKIIQLLPGVQSGSEGTSGFYVRGGGPDQNLILLDGVPVYNADHLFGFFSVFNADAISNIKLIKGGFPARYGGRLSSVLDIRMKEGNTKKIKGEGSIGIISSKLSIEGPIQKDKTSFIVSGRRTYIDILAQPLIAMAAKSSGEKVTAGYYFYDLNAKINHKFSNKSRLYLSAYMGNDKAYVRNKYEYINDDTKYEEKNNAQLAWGNITTALRWNYKINKKLFSNTTLTYSKYKFLVGQKMEEKITGTNINQINEFEFNYSSGIDDVTSKVDFDYIPSPNHFIRFGIGNTYHTFNPGITAFKLSSSTETSSTDTSFGNSKIYGNEVTAYIEDDFRIGANLKINIGAHFSGFYVKEEFYKSIQPRVSARYLINEFLSIKAAYSQMNQYIHLLTTSRIGLPTDLWLPVTDSIKPMRSDQVAIGAVYALDNNMDISIEGFYKTMDNLLEYKEGASFFKNNAEWDEKVEMGKGWAYGVEVFLQKTLGNTSGWIGYTLSWSERQFENINFGERFPYRYDRRHDMSIVVTHKINDNIDISGTWVYGTGNAITLGLEKYNSIFGYNSYYTSVVEHIESRNNYRMPSYHRLDVGINMHKEKKWGERTWSFGVYNLYNRKNPFYLYFGSENNNRVLKQVSLFPIIPSIRYSFKF